MKLDDLLPIAHEGLHRLFGPPDVANRSFFYSDGTEVESSLLQTLTSSIDVSLFSHDLGRAITDWPSMYHLSPKRHNLLRHIPFRAEDRVLELGCGCGAITRLLGERASKVDAVEGNAVRAMCAATRTRDLPNVSVYISDFRHLQFNHEYDYVLLIGVLEYSPIIFPEAEDPIRACLELARGALKSSGKLIVAIENRLGLKYFQGLPEDHTGSPYCGIEDRYGRGSPTTLGRVELGRSLRAAGFSEISFQYPFPDYKLPDAVFTERGLRAPEFQAADIIRCLGNGGENPFYPAAFSSVLAWPSVAKNGLLADLSNSFLVMATNDELESEESLLGFTYSTDRVHKYNTTTRFEVSPSGGIYVYKSLICSGDTSISDDVLVHNPEDQPYFSGPTLHGQLIASQAREDIGSFLDQLRIWIEFLSSNAIRKKNGEDLYASQIDGAYIDCLPNNLVLHQSGPVFIDREWSYLAPVRLDSLILRYLYRYSFSTFINSSLGGCGLPLRKLCEAISLNLDEKTYQAFAVVENHIRRTVLPSFAVTPVPTSLHQLYRNYEAVNGAKHQRRFPARLLSRLKGLLNEDG